MLSRELVGVDFDELHLIDEDLETSEQVNINWSRPGADILADVRDEEHHNDDDADGDDDQNVTSTVTPTEALKALCTIQWFSWPSMTLV